MRRGVFCLAEFSYYVSTPEKSSMMIRGQRPSRTYLILRSRPNYRCCRRCMNRRRRLHFCRETPAPTPTRASKTTTASPSGRRLAEMTSPGSRRCLRQRCSMNTRPMRVGSPGFEEQKFNMILQRPGPNIINVILELNLDIFANSMLDFFFDKNQIRKFRLKLLE